MDEATKFKIMSGLTTLFEEFDVETKKKCKLCNETLTHVVAKIEADSGASERSVCSMVASETGLTERQVVGRVRREKKKESGSKRDKKGKSPESLTIPERVAGTIEEKGVTKSEAIKIIAKEEGIKPETIRKKYYREAKKYAEKQTFNRTSDSAIEWAKYTWNPVTGCKHGCSYCYAEKIANRGIGVYQDIKFKPHLHKERLAATLPENLPQNVPTEDKFCFVVSMGDLFGSWVKKAWIDKVMDAIRLAPDWTFLLLTKNPKRYSALGESYFPDNVWIGASAGNKKLANSACRAFSKFKKTTTFISCEPLEEKIKIDKSVKWVIVGAQTNPVIQPPIEAIKYLVSHCYMNKTPIYFKPNLDFSLKERPFDKKLF